MTRFMRGYTVTTDNEDAPSKMLPIVNFRYKITKLRFCGHTCTSSVVAGRRALLLAERRGRRVLVFEIGLPLRGDALSFALCYI